MSTEESLKGKTPAARSEKTIKATNNKARNRTRDEEKVAESQVEAEPVSTEAMETLAVSRAEVEPEHSIGQVLLEQESTLIELDQAAEVEAEKRALALLVPGATEQRVSFVVRLTVDQQSQPRRTEIEHVHSGQKEAFPGLDVQRLAAFMQACLGSPLVPELAPSPTSVSKTISSELSRVATKLVVSKVQISSTEDFATGIVSMIHPAEAFMIQTRFRLQGQEAPLLTAQASAYQIQVYANEMNGGKSTFLTSYNGTLVKDVLEYTVQTQAPGLPSGLYRLITLIDLQEPVKMTGHYQGPLVQVIGVRQPASELLAGGS